MSGGLMVWCGEDCVFIHTYITRVERNYPDYG